MLHRIGEMDEIVCLSIRLVIPSIPAAELFLSLRIRDWISTLEQLRREREEVVSYWSMGTLEASARLKHSEKKQLNLLAISAGVLAVTPLYLMELGIED